MTIFFITLTVVLASVGATYYGIIVKQAKLDNALLPSVKSQSVFLDKNQEEIQNDATLGISPDEIPQVLENAFIAVEDKRFYKHNGVDYIRIAGALKNNIASGKLSEGGSTISQQLIKNTHLSQEKTFDRKIKEIKIAKELEKSYTKKEIMAMYLNVIYFGNGIYGISNASKSFFNKSVDELTVSECATLVAVLKNPLKYSPLNDIENAKSRRNLVLRLMTEQGYISEEERDSAVSQDIVIAKETNVQANDCYIKSAVYEASKLLNISPQTLLANGYTIKTYFDSDAQNALNNAIDSKELYALNKNQNAPERSALLLENQTCGISAYVSTNNRQLFDFRRPVGSTVKPVLIYAPAFEHGFITAATPILDEKVDFGGYSPKNYGDNYLGWIDTRTAIMQSSNVASVKTYNALGFDKVSEFAEKLGINLSNIDNNATLALGNISNGLNFAEISACYAMLANYGAFQTPTFIKSISDANGRLLYRHNENITQVMSAENAYIISDILNDTATYGTAKGLSGLPFEAYSKTGTVGDESGNTDAYNIAYTSSHTALVWHGNSSGKKQENMSLSETGGAYTTKTMKYILSQIYLKNQPQPIAPTQNIVTVDIDTYAQLCKQEVLLATINTPTEYVKPEIFTQATKPDSLSPYFTSFSIRNLETEIIDGSIVISFDGATYLKYEINRIVNNKPELIASIKNQTTDKISYIDIGYPINQYFKYSIKPYFCNQFGEIVYGNESFSGEIYISLSNNSFDFSVFGKKENRKENKKSSPETENDLNFSD